MAYLVISGDYDSPVVLPRGGPPVPTLYAVGNRAKVLALINDVWTPVVTDIPTRTAVMDIWGTAWDNIYVVTSGDATGSDPITARIYHFDGSSWTMVFESDAPGYYFNGIWGSGLNDIYAVGMTPGWGNYIVHWDGSTWSIVDPIGNRIMDIIGFGADNVLLASTYRFTQWNGSAWVLHTPDILPNDARLWGSGPNDVYAFRGYPGIQHSTDGTYDTVTNAYPIPTFVELVYAMHGTGPGNVWAVGAVDDSGGPDGGGLVLHFDGATWTVWPQFTTHRLTAVYVASASEIYVGDTFGQIWRSTDSGTSWTPMTPEGADNIANFWRGPPTIDHIELVYPWLPQSVVNGQSDSPNVQFSIQIGGTGLQFGAIAYDALNNPIPGVTFNWNVWSPDGVLNVDPTGLVTADSGTFGWVWASAGDANSSSAALRIVVDAIPTSAGILSGFSLAVGDISYLSGSGWNSGGGPYLAAVYDNADPTVAQVDPDGIIHGLSVGVAHISVTVEGVTSSVYEWPIVASPDHFQLYDADHNPLGPGATLTIPVGTNYWISADAYDGDDNVISPQLFCWFHGDNPTVLDVSDRNSSGGMYAAAVGTTHVWVTAGTTTSYMITVNVV